MASKYHFYIEDFAHCGNRSNRFHFQQAAGPLYSTVKSAWPEKIISALAVSANSRNLLSLASRQSVTEIQDGFSIKYGICPRPI